MKRALKRIATLAVALPLALGLPAGAADAAYSATLPGCYGGGTSGTVICNLTVTIGVPAGVQPYETTVPICAGTCQFVPVTLARTTPGEPLSFCYTYNTLGAAPTTTCYTQQTAQPVVNTVTYWVGVAERLAQSAVEDLVYLVENPRGWICDRIYLSLCYYS